MLDEMSARDQHGQLGLVLVDRGVTTAGGKKLGDARDVEVRRVGHAEKPGTFVPLPVAWRVEVAHGRLLGQRRLARSFKNTLESASGWLQVACLAVVLKAAVAPAATLRRRRRSTR
ncbi:MAG TPA: hypothetical protein VLR26_03145 [Frankiaceae bacterium]|nr:hypothetical protein [Frankiaceae bacterium]